MRFRPSDPMLPSAFSTGEIRTVGVPHLVRVASDRSRTFEVLTRISDPSPRFVGGQRIKLISDVGAANEINACEEPSVRSFSLKLELRRQRRLD